MRYNKDKYNALRYFLAQTSDDGLYIRHKIITIRDFRTEAAERLFKNPFLTGAEEVYVLSKICEWVDMLFPPNWEMYATPEGIIQLARALKHEEYTPVEDIGSKKRKAIFGICKSEFRYTLEKE